mmetsp:Transcript_9511/g.26602  ORF Transcript_9511/g.26602 Transcript_9511/m.26602 type:complete len:201 (+) Transcript_9511:954-1556(+)
MCGELLRARPRPPLIGLCASQVRQPVHEVETDVRLGGRAPRNHLLELRKKQSWWRLTLHQPSIVEAHLPLHEENRCTLAWLQTDKAGQEEGEVLHHIGQSHIVVVDGRLSSVTLVWGVLREYRRCQFRVLHHVVDSLQNQHGNHTVVVDDGPSARVQSQQVRLEDQLLDSAPVHGGPELPLLGSVFLWLRARTATFVDTE